MTRGLNKRAYVSQPPGGDVINPEPIMIAVLLLRTDLSQDIQKFSQWALLQWALAFPAVLLYPRIDTGAHSRPIFQEAQGYQRD